MAEPADGYMSNERPGLYPSGHHQMSKQACRKSFACIAVVHRYSALAKPSLTTYHLRWENFNSITHCVAST